MGKSNDGEKSIEDAAAWARVLVIDEVMTMDHHLEHIAIRRALSCLASHGGDARFFSVIFLSLTGGDVVH